MNAVQAPASRPGARSHERLSPAREQLRVARRRRAGAPASRAATRPHPRERAHASGRAAPCAGSPDCVPDGADHRDRAGVREPPSPMVASCHAIVLGPRRARVAPRRARAPRAPDIVRAARRLAVASSVSCPQCWTSSRRCSSWSSSRRSTSATCSSRAAARRRSGTPTWRRPGKQVAHERHLKAINEAADQLERIAETSRGGTRHAQRGQGQRRRRAQGARGGGPPRLRGGAAPRAPPRPTARKHDPFGSQRPRPLGRAPLRALPLLPGVGRRRGRGHLLHRRRRRHPAVGARALPARACARCRPTRCSSSTSASPTRAPSACSAS